MTVGDEVQLVTFRLGGQDFAFTIFQVERILRYQEPARLPKAPVFLEGMVRYGESVVPVVDLRKRVSVDAPLKEETRIMILEWEDGKIGVVVDAVLEVMKVPAERISPPTKLVRGLAAEYITGIVALEQRTIVVLSPGKLLSSKERLALDAMSVETTR